MRCGNCPTTFCQYRRTDGECVFSSLPNGPWNKGYEPTDATKKLDLEEDSFKKFTESVKALVVAVEGYIEPKKGDKYVFRNEVLEKCNELKKLLEK